MGLGKGQTFGSFGFGSDLYPSYFGSDPYSDLLGSLPQLLFLNFFSVVRKQLARFLDT